MWPSRHRTSWSSRPERLDYISFATLFLHYMVECARQTSATHRPLSDVSIVFGGYSYGSMIASRMPSVHDMSSLFRDYLSEFDRNKYAGYARSLLLDSAIHGQNPSQGNAVHGEMNDPVSISTSYLLVSPIVPPVTWALAMPFGNPFVQPSMDTYEHLSRSHTLAVFGGKDIFASREKLLQWASQLQSAERSNFTYHEVIEAGHFWAEAGALTRLLEAVRAWAVVDLPPGQ